MVLIKISAAVLEMHSQLTWQHYVFKDDIANSVPYATISCLCGQQSKLSPEVLWATQCTIARGCKAEGDSESGRPHHRGQ